MPEYYNVTTNLGGAEIANAIATNTKLNITHIAFGDGNGSVPTPNKTRTSLLREVHRQAVTKYERHATNANWIVIETIIPSDVGGFTIREMGIIANGKLISHGSHAPFEKVADPSGVSEYRLRFTQNVTDGSVVEITLDGSLIYASQAWVEENFIKRSDIVDNLTTNNATKPVSAKQAKLLQDNKLDKTANAASATKLVTAREINGVSFDGTDSIDLATIIDSNVDWDTLKTPNNYSIRTTVGGNRPITNFGTLTVDGLESRCTQTFVADTATSNTFVRSCKDNVWSGWEELARVNGNVASATKLATARTIGGVSFDGTANINLPGVNTAGNQNTSGNAASATKLATARTIGGVSFDGTANINLPGVNTAGNQNTSGNAASATDCSRSVIAGNGLSGGGVLTANRTLTLGTPTKITSSSTNSVTTTSHTHEIDNASTSVAGVVQLNDTLTSTSTTQALTAAQGKVLNDQAFGIHGRPKNVTASRMFDTEYVNTDPYPRQVYISCSAGPYADNIIVKLDDEAIFKELDFGGGVAWVGAIFFIVRPGGVYKITSNYQSTPGVIRYWSEV